MFEFLVETHAPYESPSAAARHVEDIAHAAEQVSEPAAEVHLVRAIFVPEDDIQHQALYKRGRSTCRAALLIAEQSGHGVGVTATGVTGPRVFAVARGCFSVAPLAILAR